MPDTDDTETDDTSIDEPSPPEDPTDEDELSPGSQIARDEEPAEPNEPG